MICANIVRAYIFIPHRNKILRLENVNMSKNITIKKAAVLGAGVMGAQIAAHLTNAGIQTFLFDLPSDKGGLNAIVESSLKSLLKLKPTPLGVDGIETKIIPANYQTDLALLKNCDLVIEAISERLDWKESLYAKVSPHLNENVIFGSNTSGLSIQKLAQTLPATLRPRFCGIHFFNPPRYMKLVEVIAHSETDKSMMESLETFLVSRLGKGVVIAKDTPNFIGNRIGVFSLLSALHHSQELGLTPDTVDAITGPLLGRPKSATFRTMDVVGLDTMAHVVNTMRQDLTNDPWLSYFELPAWIKQLIDKGALGQKRGAGVYKKVNDEIQVWDQHDNNYRPSKSVVSNALQNCMKLPLEQRFKELAASPDPQAQFLWRHFRDLFHYCAFHLKEIAQTVQDVDLAMRWGYGWVEGPFETWQSATWLEIAKMIEQDIANNKTMSNSVLPAWVNELSKGPYQEGKAFDPTNKQFEAGFTLPVYKKQYFPDAMLGAHTDEGKTVFETEAVRMWTLDDNIPILSFKSKKNTISIEVLEGIQEAIARAEKDFDALVLWQRHDFNFSLGANLKQILDGLKDNRYDNIEKTVDLFQQTALKLRYAQVPTVAAIRGMTLGGGCELSMHTSRIVAAFETYIGLVEVGVGILPAGAGSKELALRAALRAYDKNIFNSLKPYFEQITMAQVSSSALDAKRLGYLQPADVIVFNTDELLYVAKKQAALLAVNYMPPLPPQITVAGKPGIANFKTAMVNMLEGGFISAHEYNMGCKIATVLCGGEVEANSIVDEQWLCRLELEAVLELVKTPQTLERVKHMLEKGKALRN